jgi:glycosyltransferase involved in cell wall biosynthesis
MNNNYPLVTLAAPIRNRQDYLPYYLNCIKNQTFPLENIMLLFVLNNSTDNSEKLFYEFKNNYQEKFMKIRIEKCDSSNIPEDNRDTATRNIIYFHLAFIRNYILQQTKTEWLFSVDSDIMLLPHSLEQLLSSNKKCISALINNGHKYAEDINKKVEYGKVKAEMFTNIMRYNAAGTLIHVPKSEWNGIVRVNMTGAVYLLHKDIYKKCQYKADPQGEDIPFSKNVEAIGETLWCDTNLKLPHCMTKELLQKYINNEFVF